MFRALVFLLLLFPSLAKADFIEADFSGIAVSNQGTYNANSISGCPIQVDFNLCTFRNQPFHAVFIFDTNLGTKTTSLFSSSAPPQTAILTIDGVGSFNFFFGPSSIDWLMDDAGNLLNLSVNVGAYYYHFTPSFFQMGPCPGAPCSALIVTDRNLTLLSTAQSPVPAPIAGAGIPGLILLGFILAWRRARCEKKSL